MDTVYFYTLAGLGSIIILLMNASFCKISSKWYWLFGVLAMVIWRIPSWMHPYSLCIDEAEWLALASRLNVCGLPYQCFNGSTSGFMSILVLKPFIWLQAPLNYFNLRIFGFVFMILPSIYFLMKGIRKAYGSLVEKQLALWVLLYFVFGFFNNEYLSYNTEYALMLGASFLYLKYNNFKADKNTGDLIMAGLAIGILPYFKLQSVPLVFGFYVIFIYTLFREISWKQIFYFHLSLGIFSVVIFTWFWVNNTLLDFYRMYIESAAYYVNHRITSYKYSDNEFIHKLRAFKGMNLDFFRPLYVGLFLVFIIFIKKIANKSTIKQINWAWIFLFLLACYSTYTTGNGFGHYNIIVVLPLFYIIANFYSLFLTEETSRKSYWISALGAGIMSSLFIYQTEIHKYENTKASDVVCEYIKNRTTPTDQVIFYGWVDALEKQVETSRILGSRNATEQYLIIGDSSLRNYYQQKFIEDLRNNKPVFIIDVENKFRDTTVNHLVKEIYSSYHIDTILAGETIFRRNRKLSN